MFILERDQAVHLPVLLDYALLREEHAGAREVVHSHGISASPILRAYFVAISTAQQPRSEFSLTATTWSSDIYLHNFSCFTTISFWKSQGSLGLNENGIDEGNILDRLSALDVVPRV